MKPPLQPTTRGRAAAFAIALALGPLPAAAQTPNPSFAIIGPIEALTLDSAADPLSGGSVRVNGLSVTLPRNLLLTLPGQYLTLNDLFRGPHPGSGATLAPVQPQSGLALADTPRPTLPLEMHLIGNIVDGRYIAGHAKIVPMELGTGAGFVRQIDITRGELLVGAERTAGETPAQQAERDDAAARVRLNDPQGVHGKPNAAKFTGADPMDERLALDPDNPAVVAVTGFPMCIPRSAADPDCPAANRAAPPAHTRFTCGPVAAESSSPAHPGCDPAKAAPVLVGDYVTYAGALVPDPEHAGRFFVAAHALHVQAGIYTSPGADPAHVFIEESLMGMLGEPFPGVDQEQTSRFRLVGFTTDPSRDVEVHLLDQAPGAAEPTERLLTVLTPQRAGQIGRIRITLPSKANFLAVTRDVRVRIVGSAAGIGQYTAPIGEYIYPENTRFGQRPAFPVPVPFENFCELRRGGGPLTTLGRSGGPLIGPLDPFPESGHPTAQPRADGSPSCL